MGTVFEKIIAEEIPGNFVWADEVCVGITTIAPVTAGHILIIPRDPIDKWTDLPPTVLDHVMRVSQIIGKAQEKAFGVPRAAVVIAGFEVPHTHVHVIPARSEADCQLSKARPAQPAELADTANALRDTLRNEGYSARVPMDLHSPALP